MNEELLATRLEVMLRSANEVHSAVTVLETSRKAVEKTKGALFGATLDASQLGRGALRQLTDVLERLRGELSTDDVTGRVALEQTIAVLESLEANIPALVSTLNNATHDLDLLLGRHVEFDTQLGKDVHAATDGLTRDIRTLQREVSTAAGSRADLWLKYSETIAPTAENLFSQYIDLLSGVAIRERGLSMSALQEVFHLEGLCRMIDWHVSNELRQRVPGATDMLTLPGRASGGDLPPSGGLQSWPIARLGCAHWSIWGMPLEAHEFGKVAGGKNLNGRPDAWSDELAAFGAHGLSVLVADAIAAWAEGPAYACALCFLALDPRETVITPERGHVSSAERARVVATCLRGQIVPDSHPDATPEQVDGGYGYLEFIARIFDCWNSALEAPAHACTDRNRLLDALPARVRQEFELTLPFEVSDWRISKEVWSALEQSRSLRDDPPTFIRHLMNAAWYARLSSQSVTNLEPAEIERRTLVAGREITDPLPANGRGGSRNGSEQGEKRIAARSGSIDVIMGTEPEDPGLTAGVSDIALGLVSARSALNDARHEELASRLSNAAHGFERVISLVDEHDDGSSQSELLRAGALAGLSRTRADDGLREAAVERFAQIADQDLDSADLADWASVSESRQRAHERYADAVTRGGGPPWAYWRLATAALKQGENDVAVDHLRHAVRAAPMDAELQATYGVALERAGESSGAAAAFSSAAVLLALEGDREPAWRLAEDAVRLEPARPISQIVLGDLHRVTGDVEAALDVLGAVAAAVEPGSVLGVVATRALVNALAADGRRNAALETLRPRLAGDGVSPDDLLLAGGLEATLSNDAAAAANYERAFTLAPRRPDVLRTLVRHYLRQHRLADAQRVVRDAIELGIADRAGSPELHILLGELRSRAGEPGAPDEDIERARLIGLDPAYAWEEIGEMRAREGDHAGAVEALHRSLALAPDVVSRRLRLAELALESGQRGMALGELEHAARLQPDDPNVQLLLADERAGSGDYDGAQAAINAALALVPEHPLLLAVRGRVNRQRGELTAAIEDLEASVRRDPSLAWAGAELFHVHATMSGEREAAAAVVEVSIDVTFVVSVAQELVNAGAPQLTVSLLSAYLASEEGRGLSDDSRAAVLTVRATAKMQLPDEIESAESDLRESVRLVPENPDAIIQLALVLAHRRQPEAAASHARRARELDPGSATIAFLAVQVIGRVEGVDEALREAAEAVRQIGADADLLGLQAELLIAAGKSRDALALTQQLRERWPASDLDRIEGLAFARLGDTARAIPLLERVVTRDPSDFEATAELAGCLIGDGLPEKAIDLVGDLDPTNPSAIVARTFGGLALVAAGRQAEALDAFLAIVAVDPSFAWPRIELAQTAWDLGQVDLAKQHVNVLLADEALRIDPEVARLAWLVGETDAALARLDAILACDEAGADAAAERERLGSAWTLRAGILFERDDPEGAIEAGTRALSYQPELANARLIIADAHLATNHPGDALAILSPTERLGVTPDADVELKRAEVLFTLDQGASAAEVLDHLVGAPDGDIDVGVRVKIAEILIWWDQEERAATILDEILTAAPAPAPAVLRVAGLLLSSIGEFERAVSILEAASVLEPTAAPDESLAWAYSNLDEPPFDKWLAAVQRVLDQQPGDAWMLKARADALLLQVGLEAARPVYEEALNRLGSVSDPRERHSLAGWCCYRVGELERAVEHLLRANSAASARANGDRLDLGLTLLAAGRSGLAKEEYDRALDELRDGPGDLRRHGVLRVAWVDLTEALENDVVPRREAVEVREAVRHEIDGCRPAFARIDGFLNHLVGAAGQGIDNAVPGNTNAARS